MGTTSRPRGLRHTSSWTTVASSRSLALNQHLRRLLAPRSRRLRRPRRTGIRRTSLSTGRSLGTPLATISSRRARREKKTLRRRRLQRISLKKQYDKPKEPKKPKIETTKTDLESEDSRMDLPLLDGDTFEASRANLAALDKADKERVEKETALNELQSFNFDLGDKIYQEDHEAASTEAEREAIQAEVSKVSDWLDEEAGV